MREGKLWYDLLICLCLEIHHMQIHHSILKQLDLRYNKGKIYIYPTLFHLFISISDVLSYPNEI
jgi:hypothetical protein